MSFNAQEVFANLDKVESHFRGKLARRACRASTTAFANIARGVAPHKTGATRAAIKVRAMRRSRSRVGVKMIIGADWFKGDEFYAAFVEFGHKIGKRATTVAGRKNDTRTRSVPGTKWGRNAFKANKKALQAIMVNTIREGLPGYKSGGGEE